MAAAIGVCRERQAYEGEAASGSRRWSTAESLRREDEDLAYPFGIPRLQGSGLPYIEPLAMWRALLGDLHRETPAPVIAARFHKGLARAIVAMARKLRCDGDERLHASTVALSGGVLPEPRRCSRR